ncbi:MAG TPA: efflux RND transporter periplasmic adaptor subunit [Chitinophagaceae bacterium]|nr:efflux RND transporter periplasmic adaptor subunit [Chitinophagaceae bacterium]
MKNKLTTLLLAGLALFAASCGSANKDARGDLNDKKAELKELKTEQQQLNAKIAGLEKEIAKLDTGSAATAAPPKLVKLEPVQSENFTHYIDLQGRLDATNISYVAPPNGQGGIVTALYVTQGQSVRKGQVLARLNSEVLQQNVEPLKVQLAAAEDTYRRTKNLFDQGIGTYQQVLTAQTQVETLKKQIAVVREQISQFTVTAPSSGVADIVNVRVGEMFTGTTMTGPQIRIVNTGSLKVIADVPENYLGRIGVGTNVRVTLPNLNRVLTTKVNVAGKVIDPAKRTFYIEAPVPSDPAFKPNQVATVQIQDYAAANAVTIPVNTLQNDDKGKYVMVAATEGGKLVARKRYVVVGELYQDRLEVKSGIQAGDRLITEGFQSLYDGQSITA